ncbi:metal ABC transporter substrate-binding protein [Agromyces atrinae]|uniref:zinc ABC transporter substrate-binding protein AztC n=1 Tax=Agromyces atrinae TaxID=592376 RepID=UPI001F59C46D|nr:zinc ABC transporter substrate-binding protein AztC [Agromyces atrinae]MCI2956422.1 metal ABC transporter substrate-binding protein [Agromyces atrinae]
MTRRIALALLAASALVLSGCSSAANVRPSVVVTTNILGDVVSELVGDEADVLVLMPPNADPHSFEISAQEAARIGRADLLVTNGLGLEEGLQSHVDAAVSDGVDTIAAGDLVDVIAYDDESGGGAPDPHFWTDPARMLDVVDGLGERLAAIDGIDADTVEANTAAYRGEIEQLETSMADAFAAIPRERRALVTNHHVFGYLAERFDFTVVGAVIPSGTTLAAPSASDLASLSAALRETGVTAIFADSSQPDRLAQVIAEEAGRDVRVIPLFTESLTAPGEGAATYLEMMRANTDLLVDGLAP